MEEICDEEIKIVWLEGEYNKQWKTARHQDPNHRGRMVEWRDTIPKSSIILFDFKLTTTNRLRKVTVENLKKLYAEYNSKNN